MKNIAVALVCKGTKVLLVRRRQREGDLHWQFPAGELLDSESPMAAAVREVAEETGVECIAIRVLGDRVHPSSGVHIVYVVCDYIKGEAQLLDDEELDMVEWQNSNSVQELITSSIFPPILEFLSSVSSALDS